MPSIVMWQAFISWHNLSNNMHKLSSSIYQDPIEELRPNGIILRLSGLRKDYSNSVRI